MMWFPPHKRIFSVLTPPTDAETRPQKKTCAECIEGTVEGTVDTADTGKKMSTIEIATKDNIENKTEIIPQWARTLLEKVTQTHDVVASLEARIKNLETIVDMAKQKASEAKEIATHALDLASGGKDLAKECMEQTSDFENKLENIEKENKLLRQQIQQMNDYSRRENLILEGLEDDCNETHETLQKKLHTFIKDKLAVVDASNIQIDKFHRLGKSDPERCRAVIMRFKSTGDRMNIWNKRKNLKGSKYYLKEDFSPATKEARHKLNPYLRAARAAGRRATLVGEKLLVNGARYTVEDMPSLEQMFGKPDEGSNDGWRQQGRWRHWRTRIPMESAGPGGDPRDDPRDDPETVSESNPEATVQDAQSPSGPSSIQSEQCELMQTEPSAENP